MKKSLSGTALVTGGSSGIGLEYSRQLAAMGCNLVIVSNKADDLDKASEALSSEYGVSVKTRFQDLSAVDSADNLHDWCIGEGIIVDILVSNAGLFFFRELADDNYGKAKAIVGLHVETPTRLCILFGNDMKKMGHGTIISMSSLAADLPVPGITLYSATKSYLKSFGIAFSHELHPYGVSITTACPGAIETPLYGLRPDLMKFAKRIGVIKTPSWLVRRVLNAAIKKRVLVKARLIERLMVPVLKLIPYGLENRLWVRFRR